MFANGTKPYINLLWVVLPFVVRRSEWKVRFSRAVYAVLTAAGALALTFGVEQYGTLLRHNYGAIARQGGTTVNGGAQLLFVLKNPLRYIAVLLGTLYENDGFIGQLGLFGWKDMPVAFISDRAAGGAGGGASARRLPMPWAAAAPACCRCSVSSTPWAR